MRKIATLIALVAVLALPASALAESRNQTAHLTVNSVLSMTVPADVSLAGDPGTTAQSAPFTVAVSGNTAYTVTATLSAGAWDNSPFATRLVVDGTPKADLVIGTPQSVYSSPTSSAQVALAVDLPGGVSAQVTTATIVWSAN